MRILRRRRPPHFAVAVDVSPPVALVRPFRPPPPLAFARVCLAIPRTATRPSRAFAVTQGSRPPPPPGRDFRSPFCYPSRARIDHGRRRRRATWCAARAVGSADLGRRRRTECMTAADRGPGPGGDGPEARCGERARCCSVHTRCNTAFDLICCCCCCCCGCRCIIIAVVVLSLCVVLRSGGGGDRWPSAARRRAADTPRRSREIGIARAKVFFVHTGCSATRSFRTRTDDTRF